MIKAVLFDLDGTLIDTNDLIIKSFKYTFTEALGIDVSNEEIIRTFGKPLHKTFEAYDNNRVDELIDIYRTFNKSHHDNMCKIFDGVHEMMKNLKNKNIKIGIVTSKKEDLAKRGMDINNISEYIDIIITPEKTKKHKPHKEPVEKACEELGVATKEVLMVGDSMYDIMSGNSAGAKTIAVEYTVMELDEIKNVNPNYWVKELMEIVGIVEELNSI